MNLTAFPGTILKLIRNQPKIHYLSLQISNLIDIFIMLDSKTIKAPGYKIIKKKVYSFLVIELFLNQSKSRGPILI